MKIILPDNVKVIINTFRNKGFKCYAVGGCIRDSLLGIIPKDWDLTTDATPMEIKETFSEYKTFDSGIEHGTVSVIINSEVYEVTTFRIDGDYTDSRHPDNVKFTSDLKDDLIRRDFTVNAMAYSAEEGVIDYFNGIEDLKYKAIRCVGDPDERFCEDSLRILRALRFSSAYGFSIEHNTSEAIIRNKNLINTISVERISSEFIKILCGDNCQFILTRYKDVIASFLPEIRSMFNFDQNTPHHNRDLWKHTVATIKYIENTPVLRTTMFFHDIAKPIVQRTDEKNISHYKGHNKLSAAMTNNILRRFNLSNEFINQVVLLIKFHDMRVPATKESICKLLKIIGEENFRLLLKVQSADVKAQSKYMRTEKEKRITDVEQLLNKVIADDCAYSLKQLCINGTDLLHVGIHNGIEIGFILDKLLTLVICDSIKNEKDELLSAAQKIFTERHDKKNGRV